MPVGTFQGTEFTLIRHPRKSTGLTDDACRDSTHLSSHEEKLRDYSESCSRPAIVKPGRHTTDTE